MDSKLFARYKWEGHCLHHMLSLRQSSCQMILRSRGGGIHLMSLVWHMKRQSDPS